MSIEDGELCWRKRDFLWLAVKLAAWKKRAIARVEASYAQTVLEAERSLRNGRIYKAFVHGKKKIKH